MWQQVSVPLGYLEPAAYAFDAVSVSLLTVQVMLYDDEEGDCITPEDVFERLDDDLAVADAVVWVGISFEQSASTEYFRKVRSKETHCCCRCCCCVNGVGVVWVFRKLNLPQLAASTCSQAPIGLCV